MEQLSELELQERLNAAKREREAKCLVKITEALKEFNCQIGTSELVVINGKPITATIVAL